MKMNTINFERKQGMLLYRQLYEKLKTEILAGHLRKGDQLPSIRQCEKLLHISKTSVERAYELLMMEGYIKSVPQSGYFIDLEEEHRLIRKQLAEKSFIHEKQPIRYDFRSQTMETDAFDTTLWKKYLREVLDQHEEISTYGDAQGEYALRLALGKYAFSMRGVIANAETMLIGASFQSLLYILCGYLQKDTVIGMEESGFLQAEQVFADFGFPICKLKSTKTGIDVQELLDNHVGVLYINAGSMGYNHQPLAPAIRKALLTWAKQNTAMIIEDDHNGELRYHSRAYPCMQSFAVHGEVIYIGSFSKLLLPSIRISYLVMPEWMAARYEAVHYGPSASKIEQLALAAYIGDGNLERHVKRLKKRYEQKSSMLLKLLQQYCPKGTYILEEAALQIIVRFPFPVAIEALLKAGKQQNILYNENASHEIVLSFAGIQVQEMEVAVQELTSLWKACDERLSC